MTIGEVLGGFRTADQADTSNDTTLRDVTNLTIAVPSTGRFAFFAWVNFTIADITMGAKFGVNGPTAADIRAEVSIVEANAAPIVLRGMVTAVGGFVGGALANTATPYNAVIRGSFEPSAAGTLAIQFGKNVASAGAFTIKRGSYIVVIPMG